MSQPWNERDPDMRVWRNSVNDGAMSVQAWEASDTTGEPTGDPAGALNPEQADAARRVLEFWADKATRAHTPEPPPAQAQP